MRKLYIPLLALLICFSFQSSAQEKVVDKSGKRPKWANGVEKDYVITSATGTTAEEAKDKALSDVKSKIVFSVAQVVSSTNTLNTQEDEENGIYTFLEQYKGSTQTASADQAYLQGISLNKASDFQWEKVRHKKTKEEWYVYNLKYPFSEIELNELVNAFKVEDQKMTDRLNAIERSVETTTDVNTLLDDLGQLRELVKYFPDQRKQRAAATIAKINNDIKAIRIEAMTHPVGVLSYQLMKGDQPMTVSTKPRTKSNCAVVTGFEVDNSLCVLQYDVSGCYDGEENLITVSYKFGNTRLSEDFYFDISNVKVNFFVRNGVKLSANEVSFELMCKDAGAFTIDRIEWMVSGVKVVSTPAMRGIKLEGAGNKAVTVSIEPIVIPEAGGEAKIDGKIYFTSEATGEQNIYKLLNVTGAF